MFGLTSEKKRPARAPDGRRLYAVGDIHGRADLLDALIAKIDAENSARDAVELIFLGDYVDRGPDSRGVIDRLIACRRDWPHTIFLCGNHEERMLAFLADPEGVVEWLDWGGDETLRSYGVDAPLGADPRRLAENLAAATPSEHLAFLESLELTYRAGDFLFVHAGVKPGVALHDQREEDLLWIRQEFHHAPKRERPDFCVVHGHHPVDAPQDHGWRIAVDTGAVWSGRLTAVALEGETRRFLSVTG